MSRLPYELFLALRYVRPKRTFVSVITLISVIGVTLGVAVLIIVISVMSGFDKEWHERILGFNAHLKVVKEESVLKNYEAVMKIVGSNHSVRGVAPFVLGKVLVETQPDFGSPQIDAPILRGIDAEAEPSVSNLPRCVKYGAFDLAGKSVLVGLDF